MCAEYIDDIDFNLYFVENRQKIKKYKKRPFTPGTFLLFALLCNDEISE